MIKKFNTFENKEWVDNSFEIFESAIEDFKKQYQKALDVIQEHGFEVSRVMTHKNYMWKIVIVLEKDNVEISTEPTKDFIKLSESLRKIHSVEILDGKGRIHLSSLHVEYYGEFKGHPYIEVYIG